MNTQQTDSGKEQQLSRPDFHSSPTQQTFTAGRGSPPQAPPPLVQPPPPRRKDNRWSVGVVIASIVVALMVIIGGIAVFAQLSQRPGTQGTPTPKATAPGTTATTAPGATATTAPGATVTTTPGSDSTPAPTPGVVLGPLACPAAISNPAYWDPLLPLPHHDATTQSVSCGNLLGKPSLQALVLAQLIVGGGPTIRSAFVFDNITAPQPKVLFKVERLYKGDAKISAYSTIMTAEVDQNSNVNKGKGDAKMTVDLFREFKWSSGAGTFVQAAFPGIFPDLTRYQAEADQGRVNQGQDSWKYNPAQVAQRMAVQFFGWQRSVSTTVLSGGGAKDVYAKVRVQESPVQGTTRGPSVTMTLSRLEGNIHHLWVVIAVEDDTSLTLTSVKPYSLVTSPVKLEGKGNAFEATIGQALVLDHLYTDIGHKLLMGTGPNGMGNIPYSTTLAYSSSFQQGAQEGIVEVQQVNTAISSDVETVIMRKVLLNP